LEEGLDLVEEDLECLFLFLTSLFVNSSSPLRLCKTNSGEILLVEARRGAVSIGRISLKRLELEDREGRAREEREMRCEEGQRWRGGKQTDEQDLRRQICVVLESALSPESESSLLWNDCHQELVSLRSLHEQSGSYSVNCFVSVGT
jgi:hypothetical protein